MEGGEGDEIVECAEKFNYLVRPLDKTDDDWMLVRWNIMRARLVWGVLGALLWWEGADPKVVAIFYRAVFQAILLYGLEM